jgi:hypothetical protein
MGNRRPISEPTRSRPVLRVRLNSAQMLELIATLLAAEKSVGGGTGGGKGTVVQQPLNLHCKKPTWAGRCIPTQSLKSLEKFRQRNLESRPHIKTAANPSRLKSCWAKGASATPPQRTPPRSSFR